MDRDLTEARRHLTLSDHQSPRSSINANYCASCVAGKSVCVYVTGNRSCSVNFVTVNRDCLCNRKEGQFSFRVGRKEGLFVCDRQERDRHSCPAVHHVHFANRYPQKKGVNLNCCYHFQEIKHVDDVSCVDQLSSVKNCCSRSACRGQITPVL